MSKMNINSFITKDYRKNDVFAVQKNKPKQTQFYLPPGEPALLALRSFSEGGSAAEGGLATTFFGAFLQRVADRPEKNVDTMNVLVIKSYRIYPPPADLLKLLSIVVELLVFGAVLYNLGIGGQNAD
jgi:hypothetical protein